MGHTPELRTNDTPSGHIWWWLSWRYITRPIFLRFGDPPVHIEGPDSTATEGIVTWVSKIPDIRVIRKLSQLPVTKGT